MNDANIFIKFLFIHHDFEKKNPFFMLFISSYFFEASNIWFLKSM